MKFDAYVFVNLTITVMCLLFLLVTFITYFSRKNMNNIENIIYRQMLLSNLLTLIFYIFSYLFCILVLYGFRVEEYCILFSKIAPLFIGLWILLIVFYLVYISTENNKKNNNFLVNNYKKVLIVIYFIIIIVGIFTFFENIEFDYMTGIEITPFVSMSILTYVGLITFFIITLYSIRKVSKKKVVPLILIILISLIALAFSVFNIPIIVMFTLVTLINHVMYHTIENPDMKMVNELTLAKDSAEKASRAKSEFLSSMSHELKTPLNAIIGFTESIKSSKDFEDINVDADEILSASSKLLDLVNGILDINKLDSNTMEVVNTFYNPNDEFNSITNSINVRIGDKPLTYNVRLSDNLPNKLYGDKDKIKRIITNLLTNAVKYTDSGSVELVVDCLNNNDICNLRISVSDTGRGIDDSELDKLFTKFYRRDEDKDSDIEGAGLGLAITKSLVDLLGGKITVNSASSLGTTFTVTLSQKIIIE